MLILNEKTLELLCIRVIDNQIKYINCLMQSIFLIKFIQKYGFLYYRLG